MLHLAMKPTSHISSFVLPLALTFSAIGEFVKSIHQDVPDHQFFLSGIEANIDEGSARLLDDEARVCLPREEIDKAALRLVYPTFQEFDGFVCQGSY
jgi:hypothetical protein